MNLELNVVLPTFEGPLDLLLHLLEKNEVDIYDIPIALITNQFIDYIEQSRKMSLEITSEFVVMAAHLLEIKSKMLLPIHSDSDFDEVFLDDADPRYELVKRLLEYKIYKQAAQTLNGFHEMNSGIKLQQSNEMKRYAKVLDQTNNLSVVDVSLLVEALNEVIMRIPEVDTSRRDYFKKLKRDAYTVEEKLEQLQLKFEEKSKWTFHALTEGIQNRLELVITFLALLELLKILKLKVYQEKTFSEIFLELELA